MANTKMGQNASDIKLNFVYGNKTVCVTLQQLAEYIADQHQYEIDYKNDYAKVITPEIASVHGYLK